MTPFGLASPLQRGNSGPPGQEEVDKHRGEDDQELEPGQDTGGRDVEAKPKKDLSKVVGVPADGPEARRNELALA